MNFLVDYVVSRFQRTSNGNQQPARATQYGSLATAPVEPALLELTRAGARYGGGLQIIANAIASVQAIPTTAPTLVLFNADDKKSLIVDQLGMFLASGTADQGATLLTAVTPKIAAASIPAAMQTGWNIGNLSGSVKGCKTLWATGVTVPAGSVYMAVQSNTQPAANTVGAGGNPVQLNGGIIVPPGCALALAVLSGAGTTAKYGVMAAWSELELDLE